MENRCLVGKGFCFIAVTLLYNFSNFVVISVILIPYIRMKLDYPLFNFWYHCSVFKTELV